MTSARVDSQRLVTVKLASQQTGISRWTFYRLLKEGKLKRHVVYTRVMVSMAEFEALASPKVEKLSI